MLFITCSDSLEPLLLDELKELGIAGCRPGYRGVYAPESMENIFKINYLSRLATRVLLPLAEFPCPTKDSLYREAKKIPWLDYLDENKTFAIDANIQHPEIRHSLFGAQLLKDAICDTIRDKRGARPSIDIKNPDVQLNLFIHNKKAIISFDTSGAPLYKRGWKENYTEATLSETLAAAILSRAGYNAREILCDPFCGAGTLLIEAACIATKTPAGFFREKFCFFHLPSFDQNAWESFRAEHDKKRVPIDEAIILGADSDAKALSLCREHLAKTGFEKVVRLIHSPVATLSPSRTPTLVVTDPPFGQRMRAPIAAYQDFGKFLAERCPIAPWAYMLTSSFHLVKATGRSVLSEWPIKHGGLHVTLYQLKAQ